MSQDANRWMTTVRLENYELSIDFSDHVLCLGSCFAQEIAPRLNDNKFNAVANPCGIVFNPLTLFKQLLMAFQIESVDRRLIVSRDGSFFHLDFHSDISGKSESELCSKIEARLGELREKLLKSRLLIITFGTAFTYEHLETGLLIGNCQKLPGTLFRKTLLDANALLSQWKVLMQRLPEDLSVILTVSPVRHIKDGIPENQLSKSVLRLLCHQMEQRMDRARYFPAYEILMDELRDYRFYASDLIHPRQEAVDHICTRFFDSHLSYVQLDVLKRWTKLRARLSHRLSDASAAASQKFLNETLRLVKEFEGLDLSGEAKMLEAKINDIVINRPN